LMNALLIAFGYPVQYRALRCASDAGMRVYVLGAEKASGLRFSRFCRRFVAIPATDRDNDGGKESQDAWLRRIEEYIKRFDIGVLIPADAPATRLLAQLQGRLSVPSFPIPPLDTFETLNDKWAFYHLCLQLGLRTPKTWLFPDKPSILKAIAAGELPAKLIAKPLSEAGGMGIVPIDARNATSELEPIDYEPILIQQYIDGWHIGLSVFTAQGQVIAAVVHQILNQCFVFAANEEYVRFGEAIAAHMKTSGVMNFDAQLTPDGVLYLLECNPRVYLTMDYTAIAGINMVELGMRAWKGYPTTPLTVPNMGVRTPLGLVKALVTPWKIQYSDLRMALFTLTDPLAFFLETKRLLTLRRLRAAKRTLARSEQFKEPRKIPARTR